MAPPKKLTEQQRYFPNSEAWTVSENFIEAGSKATDFAMDLHDIYVRRRKRPGGLCQSLTTFCGAGLQTTK